MKLLLATLERALPRVAPALLIVLLGLVSGPQEVGLYALAILGYTLLQAVTDGALRQVLPSAIAASAGWSFLRKYKVAVMSFGPVVLASYFAVVCLLTGSSWTTWAMLLPIALVPVASAAGVFALGSLQYHGQWGILAKGQLLGALGGLLVGTCAILGTGTLLGGALSVLMIESVVTIWNRRSAAENFPIRDGNFDPKEFPLLAGYSLFAWAQGQGDRVLIAILVGTSSLGLYSLSFALGRGPGEAVASATANVLRARLAAERLSRSKRDALLALAVALSAGMTLIFVAAVIFIVLPALGEEWSESSMLVSILALCSIPTVLNWSAMVIHYAEQRPSRGLMAPTIGLSFAIIVGICATFSLELAAWACLVRETIMLTTNYALIGRTAPWRPYAFSMFLVLSGVILVVS